MKPEIKIALQTLQTFERILSKFKPISIQTKHHFSNGFYAREIFIPAGTILTGKIHKTEHLNIVSKGRIRVLTENGIEEISAPFTMVSSPGTKRVGKALEDTVWVTIHLNPTNEKDLKALEDLLIIPETALLASEKNPCLG